MRLVHLTDLHLSSLDAYGLLDLRGKRWTSYLSWTRRRRAIHRIEVLDRVAAAVRAESADQLLVSGDLVQIGLESEIREAAEWMHGLAPPERILFVPGNHDVYARDSWPAIRRHWQPWLPTGADGPWSAYPLVRDAGGVRLVGASSACVTPVLSARGALGRHQFARLRATLHGAREAGLAACLVIHHPPLPGMARRRKALREATRLSDLLAETRPAFAVCGHLHHNVARAAGETRVFATASASSALEASYRVFDLERRNGSWQICMQLKTLERESGDMRVAETVRWAVSG